MSAPKLVCSYCEGPVETDEKGEALFTIHETEEGMWEGGPEVPLCVDCGSHSPPTCPEIWEAIADRKARAL